MMGFVALALAACSSGGEGRGRASGAGGNATTSGAGGTSSGSGGASTGTGGNLAGGAAGVTGAGGGTGASSGAGGSTGGTSGSGGTLQAGAGGVSAGASGGSGGDAGGGMGGNPTGSGPCDVAGLLICDDFEATAPGSDPDPTKFLAIPEWAKDQMGANVPLVAEGDAHSGTRSVRLNPTNVTASVLWLVPNVDLGPAANSIYVRVWMKVSVSTAQWLPHAWFIVGAVAHPFDNTGTEIRLGASNGMLDVNLNNKLGGGEPTKFSDGGFTRPLDNGMGVNLEPGAWHCLEAHFNGAGQEFRFWIDGGEVTGLHVTTETTPPEGGAGLGEWAPVYQYIRIGGQSNGVTTGEYWFDDLAVGSQPIGCNQ
jgi:hypothetical protein